MGVVELLATYQNGNLSRIEGFEKVGEFYDSLNFKTIVPYQEKEIQAEFGKEVPLSATGQKIALFCRFYKQYLQLNYNVMPADAKKINGVSVDEKLMELYFSNTEWWGKQPKSIANFVKNYNALNQLLNVGKKKKFPSRYDRLFESKLKGEDLPEYWRYLRSLGYRPKKNKVTGQVIEWVKAKAVVILVLISLMLMGCSSNRGAKALSDGQPHFSNENVVGEWLFPNQKYEDVLSNWLFPHKKKKR